MIKRIIIISSCFCVGSLLAAAPEGSGSGAAKFQQLSQDYQAPNEIRTASGAPGPDYWQQRADYSINVSLDDERQRIIGSEQIVYHNKSPHELNYLWFQLDQNRFRPDSDGVLSATAPNFEELGYRSLELLLARNAFQGGFEISSVTDKEGNGLPYVVIKTMMRLDLLRPVKAGESYQINIAWEHNIPDGLSMRARGGYEYFAEDENYIYEIAQWYPRLVAYTDYQGWQHKQFLGNGEFTLELGDFDVNITVPSDHIVAATGELMNADQVLTAEQLKRFETARSSDKSMFIVKPKEAKRNQKNKTSGTKTWKFSAKNVRDFAFASSRKFIWDAMGVAIGNHNVMAMSLYPIEAEPLWSQYSTRAIVHTMGVYSRYTFDYPYPVSLSINGPIGGMEYPMISFNKPRPFKDGTYWDIKQGKKGHSWERSKYGLISVIIHEVGHNYFPMIINSDERQWTWMDEGLNTFLQFLAEQEWKEDYPSRRGEPKNIVEYMISDSKVSIMTNSESLLQFGNNAYGKPATALNILRESILGRELFDFAFKEYARRWKFKRPTPSDFFRSMEDASGVDLDWFWRGWFYGTEHVDIAIDNLVLYQLETNNPEIDKLQKKQLDDDAPKTLTELRNKNTNYLTSRVPELKDFYDDFDEYNVTPYDHSKYRKFKDSLEPRESKLLSTDKLFYSLDIKNVGGLVTPLPLKITYVDGTTETLLIPAEIWRRNAVQVKKLFISDKEITSIEFDPNLSTADADLSNNSWPRKVTKSRFKLFKQEDEPNHMLRISEKDWEETK